MNQQGHSKMLFELSYLQTNALLALREQMASVWFPEKLEGAWDAALMRSSRHIRHK